MTTLLSEVDANGTTGNFSVQFVRPYSTGDDDDEQLSAGDDLHFAWGYGYTQDGAPANITKINSPGGFSTIHLPSTTDDDSGLAPGSGSGIEDSAITTGLSIAGIAASILFANLFWDI